MKYFCGIKLPHFLDKFNGMPATYFQYEIISFGGASLILDFSKQFYAVEGDV